MLGKQSKNRKKEFLCGLNCSAAYAFPIFAVHFTGAGQFVPILYKQWGRR
jgi:hypothetical protein